MSDPQAPKWANRILLFFLKEELVEEVLGDLEEKFQAVYSSHSPAKAKWNYWYQVFQYMRPFAIKNFNYKPSPGIMLKHNFIIGTRILLKNKLFSFINIGGLAAGMCVVLLISLWIQDELSFNTHHEHYDRIVQVMRKNVYQGEVRVNSSLPGQVGVQLANQYPNLFERVAMTFFRSGNELLTVGNQSFDEPGYFFQEDAPELLSLEMISGNRDGIRSPNGILIAESLAQKFFGKAAAVGQSIILDADTPLTISGVFKDIPQNSTFGNAAFFASMNLIYNEKNPYVWNNYNIRVYAQLQAEVKRSEASIAIEDILNRNQDPDDRPVDLFLFPMKDWRLNDNFETEYR